MDDMDAGDCSTDGSCGGDDGMMAEVPMEGVKLAKTTLQEETYLAFQQFSIGKTTEKRCFIANLPNHVRLFLLRDNRLERDQNEYT